MFPLSYQEVPEDFDQGHSFVILNYPLCAEVEKFVLNQVEESVLRPVRSLFCRFIANCFLILVEIINIGSKGIPREHSYDDSAPLWCNGV